MWGTEGRQRAPLVRGRGAVCGEAEIEEAVCVVEGRAQQLPPGRVLEGGGDSAVAVHAAGGNGLRGAETRKGRPVGAYQENSLDQVAA